MSALAGCLFLPDGQPSYDKFLAIYEAWAGNNSRKQWDDLSGNGRHLLARVNFEFISSIHTNTPAYTTLNDSDDTNRAWYYPTTIAANPGDYTVMFAFRPDRVSDAYLALLEDNTISRGYTYLVSSVSEPVVIYQTGEAAGNNSVAANTLVIMEFVLSASVGASVFLNSVQRFSGLAYTPSKILQLTAYNQTNNYVLKGEHYAFALYAGTDSALRISTRNRWAAKLGITL